MKIVAFVLLTLAAILSAAIATTTKGEFFSLAITGPQTVVKGGSDVKIHITLTNTSDNEVTIFDQNPECDYGVEVFKEHGESASATEHKRALRCEGPRMVNRNVLITLKPGESTETAISVSDLYDITRPGRYLVWVTRRVPGDLGKGMVKSNTLKIVVGS
jgi:hypothetical protein